MVTMVPDLVLVVVTLLKLGQISAILSDIDNSGRPCSVHGSYGVCMYSMVCTFNKGIHLGTCRYLSQHYYQATHNTTIIGTGSYLAVVASFLSHR